MLIITVRDNENIRRKRNGKIERKEQSDDASYSERGRAKVEFRASFINYFKRKRIMYTRICVLANISNHQELGVYMKNSFQFWMN